MIHDHSARSEQTLLIVFADITRFQHHARALADLALADLLDAYYRHVEALVLHTGGQIIKFMGDGWLAIWPESQIRAGLSSLQIIKREIDGWWVGQAWDSRLIIKAHVGTAVLGPYGRESRLDVIGNAVNAAAVLPARTIALSAAAFAALDPAAQAAWAPQDGAAVYAPIT